MTLKNSIKTAIKGLRTNKSRSALTILGIVIGITAIILIMSLGKGAQDLILNQIKGLGSATIIIEPGRESQGPSDFSSMFADSLKDREVEALKNQNNVPGIETLTPMVVASGAVSYGDEVRNFMVLGASSIITDIVNVHPEIGVFFDEEQVQQRVAVTAIGSEVKEKLFGNSDAVGQNIKIKNKIFRIIGVFPTKGQVGMLDVDNTLIVPYTTAQKYLSGMNYYHQIIAKAKSEDILLETVQDIKLTLRDLHNITDPSKDDFHVMTQEDIAQRVGTVTSVLTVFLAAIAAISLIVGGIGIMNIMLVSVTERTREIGLRKALGATTKNILTQFLLESTILTCLGGAIGVLLGIFFSFVSALILSRVIGSSWQFALAPKAILLGLGVSAFVGLVFGLYPASQASKKSPIEALRYE
ncbi:multidrug ABC transporter substrate-binding protein [bacterium (Candidatus Gribaldobacteria) CG08_land_8_20_14_0_20_39_15]|uniref:Multidrug ABC transporter substrate-binding protein n=1 Tax=bacterium (Candidatus Gribaldobacteria) CG08_land_8_20_14_0_20_39_15 TaxID=2014273 RepID=A0A2M6XUV8_9BACT|nr:MAG: multidrug ABC transporter substrate-binding protein [bacterium (Candidatus Gribaldobacteria) CG08_land_8_20_14_0_20_39_15]